METQYARLLIALTLLMGIGANAQRTTTGLQALYTFREGSGAYVQDVSGSSAPLTLRIAQPGAVQWLPGGGLRIAQPTIIKSLSAASAIAAGASASDELTLEAWLKPQNTTQDGPARILTASHGNTNRNFMLGQSTNRYVGRIRTTATDNAGSPNINSTGGSLTTQLQHIVYTLNSSGQERIFVNGQQVASGTRSGTPDNWQNNFELAIGNEINSARAWLGDIFLAAVYSRALTVAEIQMNHNAGAIQPGVTFTNELCAGTQCFVDGFGTTQRSLWLPGISFPGGVDYEFLPNGGHFEVFPDGTAHLYGENWNQAAGGYGWQADIWFSNKMNWSQWSALGRSWKGDANIVGNLFQTWDYYIIDTTRVSKLTGLGSFQGSELVLTHKPSNFYYGLQVGVAANDKNNQPGLSVWFNANGQINGVPFSGHGDFNLEGECVELPVMECLSDVTLTCEQGFTPQVAGTPVVQCEDEFVLAYTDTYNGSNCDQHIQRTWNAESAGSVATCVQNIYVIDTVAPVLIPGVIALNGCDIEITTPFTATDNCDQSVDVSITVTDTTVASGGQEPCALGSFRTQTQGGWGSNPSGNNPGAYLQTNFTTAFPNGLSIGCNNSLVLNSAEAVRDFLPSGGTASALPAGQMVNPGAMYNNVLAGQLVAATVSVAMDAALPSYSSSNEVLGERIIAQGFFAGMSVNQLLVIANQAIGGCAVNYSLSEINQALTSFNENFVDGNQSNGFLWCGGVASDCVVEVTASITATDDCGNAIYYTQTFTLEDTTGPEFTGMPVSLDVECGQIPPADTTLIQDCFGSVVSVEVADTAFSGGCIPTIMRTYTATDNCGNQSTFVQFIDVNDTTPPVFLNSPQNVALQCGEQQESFQPIVEDGCSENVFLTVDTTTVVQGCLIQHTISWTASDACGNTASVQQVVTIADNEPPVVSDYLSELTAECGFSPEWSAPEFTDNCGVVAVLVNIDTLGTGCDLRIVHSFVATDECGNTTEAVQELLISDTDIPYFIGVPPTIDIACYGALPATTPVAEDDCGSVTVTYSEEEEVIQGYCRAVRRRWLAEDECGNTAVAQQLVRFVDNQPPVNSFIQRNHSVPCGVVIPVPNVTFTDNCNTSVDVVFNTTTETAGCVQTIRRRWVATDDCGNTNVLDQTITITDTQAPAISGTTNVSLTCTQLAGFTVSAIDGCTAQPRLTYNDEVSGNACSRLIRRTWEATDDCGNTSTFIQNITVIDNVPPVFASVPANTSIPCIGVPIPGQATASDVCDPDVNIWFTDVITGSGCNRQITRTWRAADDCGNTAMAVQVIQVVDNLPPALQNVPASYAANCASFSYPPLPTNVVATDNCQVPPAVNVSEQTIPGNCPGNYQIRRTWTATDACGNTATATQVITVADTAPPVFVSTPQNVTANCNNIPPVPVLQANDACSGPVNINFSTANQTGGCPIIVRTWVASDACGNSATAVQRITLIDTQPPVISGVPPGGPVACNNIPPVPTPNATDNCDDNVDISMNESMIGNGCQYTLIRTFIAQDDCGNSSIVSQSFIVTDNVPPVFVNPQPNVTLSCTQLQGYVGPTATDGCSQQVVRSFTDAIQGSGCSYTILRTYVATDACGNAASYTQNIQVIDNVAPVISGVPLNTFVSCSNIPAVPNVTANDACSGAVPVVYQQTQVGSGCSFQLQRRWTAVDACGNTAVRTQLIFINDNQPPVISGVPANVIIGCTDPIPAVPQPVATDNCSFDGSAPGLQFNQFTETLACGYKIHRTWTATDACGNNTVATQVITVVDTQAPVLSGLPSNTAVTCAAIPAPASVTAQDACGGATVVNFQETVLTGGCPYSIVRTWTSADACGNIATATQTITVTDSSNPVLSGVPASILVSCGTVVPVAQVQATDNCLALPILNYTTQTVVNGCTTTETRTWTATDACGNEAQAQQVITYTDTEGPLLSADLEDVLVTCLSDVPAAQVPVATDCHPFTFTVEEAENTSGCWGQQSAVRVYILTDACGNSAQAIQNIVVQNNEAPLFSGVPSEVTVDCNTIPAVPVVWAISSCGDSLTTSFNETVVEEISDSTTCLLSSARVIGPDVAIWLPNMTGAPTHYVFGEIPGTLVEDANGQVHITGQVYNIHDGSQSWLIDIRLGNKRNWSQWSGLGRSYKDDMNVAEDNYLDWSYYELLAGSKLVGANAFAGSQLNLTHAPANYYYGFQLGMAANNHNDAYGLSGWFHYTGTLNGGAVSGVGDLIAENQCCDTQVVRRTWSVTDCAGQVYSASQTVNVQPVYEGDVIAYPMAFELNTFDVTGTSGDWFAMRFSLVMAGPVRIDLFDLQGQFIATVWNATAEADTPYMVQWNKATLTPGTYVFRLTQGALLMADTEMVAGE
jgi:hypothetical protein